ncbi:MAG: hypothetical protein ACYC2T_06580 [Bacillota bacterium]
MGRDNLLFSLADAKFESQLDILLQVIDDGVLGINSQGMVFLYNDNAKKLGLSEQAVVEKDGIKTFPQIPFKEVLVNKRSIRGMLIKINDHDDVVLSVNPISHSGKLYGAVAILKKFSDEEIKQHKIRA